MSNQHGESRLLVDARAAIEAKGHHTLGVRPAVTPETEPFWKAAAAGELIVELCLRCGLHNFPPRGICRRCLSRTMDWVSVDPPGVLYSVTVNHHAWAPDIEPGYVAGLVEFPHYSGIRFVGLVEGFEDEPPIGALLDFGFHTALDGLQRLHFMPWVER